MTFYTHSDPISLPHPPDPCSDCRPLRLPDGRPSGCWRCGDIMVRRMRREHFLTKPPAIAFHADFWEEKRPGLTTIIVCGADDGRVLTIGAEEFDRRSFPIWRGFGSQLACPLKYWRQPGEGNGHKESHQMTLWPEEAVA